jgi:hypothetical protein
LTLSAVAISMMVKLCFQYLHHPNLRRRIEAELTRHPELSWDAAVARMVCA